MLAILLLIEISLLCGLELETTIFVAPLKLFLIHFPSVLLQHKTTEFKYSKDPSLHFTKTNKKE